jgi:hypothetical protein
MAGQIEVSTCRVHLPHFFGGLSALAYRWSAITSRRLSALRALLVGKGVEMIHSVEFLDQAGNILSATLVEAPDDPSAFRYGG